MISIMIQFFLTVEILKKVYRKKLPRNNIMKFIDFRLLMKLIVVVIQFIKKNQIKAMFVTHTMPFIGKP